MKLNLEELKQNPRVTDYGKHCTEILCEYNNLKYVGTYQVSIPKDELKCIRIPYDVDDLLNDDGLISYTDGEIVLIGFTYGTQIFVKNPA